MKASLPHWRKLLLFLFLNVVDLLLTWLLLSEVNSDMYESNPIADWWLRRHGWAGLTIFKSLIVFLAGSFFVLGCYYRPRFTGRCLTLSCALLLAVVLYSCGLVPIGKMRAMEVQARELAAALPAEEAEQFQAAETLYLQVLDKLKAGHYRLKEAAEKLAHFERLQQGKLFRVLGHPTPGYSREECLAISLLEGIESTANTPGRAAEPLVVDRLREDFRSCYGHPPPRTGEPWLAREGEDSSGDDGDILDPRP